MIPCRTTAVARGEMVRLEVRMGFWQRGEKRAVDRAKLLTQLGKSIHKLNLKGPGMRKNEMTLKPLSVQGRTESRSTKKKERNEPSR
jgi:hypothetical protein